jgi:hypothetical protein
MRWVGGMRNHSIRDYGFRVHSGASGFIPLVFFCALDGDDNTFFFDFLFLLKRKQFFFFIFRASSLMAIATAGNVDPPESVTNSRV